MKKLLGILAIVFVLCSSAFAVDTVKVVRAGKATNTQTPIFSQITVSSINYTYTGTVTANKIVVATDAEISGQVDCATLNATGDAIAPTGYFTQLYNTNLATNKIVVGYPLTFGATCPTSTITVSGVASFNIVIPVTANGELFYIPLLKK